MKFITLISRKKNWTNATNRQKLGVNRGDTVVIKFGNMSREVGIYRAPRQQLRALKMYEQVTGLPTIAIDPYDATYFGIGTGAEIEVINPRQVVQLTLPKAAAKSGNGPAKKVVSVSGGIRKTNKEKLDELAIGDQEEFTESYVKSGVYSHAKELGIKVKKVNTTTIERTA